jgi:hypothetical protein
MTPLMTALRCAGRGWPVLPVRGKRPLTPHGQNDATTEASMITGWWRRWPDAVPTIRTVGVVGLDIDQAGIAALDDLMPIWPETPTCSTPSGGFHLLFEHPGGEIRTGTIAPGLEVKGDRSSLILAPGSGRSWDPHLGLDMPLAPMPEWMVIAVPTPPVIGRSGRPIIAQPISPYAETALDSAVDAITHAPNGQQHDTLNREVYTIAGLVAGGVLPSALALEALGWAARQMPSYDPRRPWRDVNKIVNAAFLDGLRHPREARR